MTKHNDKSICDLHNRMARQLNGSTDLEDVLNDKEAVKHGFCKQPNAFTCNDTGCIYNEKWTST